jgi:hypothetical protein
MAESELSVLSSQCLDRRIPDRQTLTEEVAAWEANRNKSHAKADWQFTTADARVKLKRLYPCFCSTRLNNRFPVQHSADRVKRIDPPSCCGANDGSNAGE